MSGSRLPDIRATGFNALLEFLTNHGEAAYRARQLYEWLWKKNAGSFDEMTNLPYSVRKLLTDNFSFHRIIETERLKSRDGSEKVIFTLHDGAVVESVLIPSGDRLTVCISSQSGCALGCKFCATGRLGFTRNLLPGEITGQLTMMMKNRKENDSRPSNIVFMGMGEPLLNYPNVKFAVERITAEDGMAISPQRITVSSVGIPKMIKKMADDDARYHFAFSLHAANDEKRNQIIPVNQRYPLNEISDALVYYHEKTGKRITVEYILFRGFNDQVSDASELAAFCRRFPVKINLIEYNPVSNTGFHRSSPEQLGEFARKLESKNLVVNVRLSKGRDIEAACGQLAGGKLTGSGNGE